MPGAYNAGRKLFGLAVYSMVPVIMLTGLVMTAGWPSPAAVGWAVVLHFTAVGLVVSGVGSARSLWPAVISGQWEGWWIDWIGPAAGLHPGQR